MSLVQWIESAWQDHRWPWTVHSHPPVGLNAHRARLRPKGGVQEIEGRVRFDLDLFAGQERNRQAIRHAHRLGQGIQQHGVEDGFFGLAAASAFGQRERVSREPIGVSHGEVKAMVAALGPIGGQAGGTGNSDYGLARRQPAGALLGAIRKGFGGSWGTIVLGPASEKFRHGVFVVGNGDFEDRSGGAGDIQQEGSRHGAAARKDHNASATALVKGFDEVADRGVHERQRCKSRDDADKSAAG
jgi:hypothetical protein